MKSRDPSSTSDDFFKKEIKDAIHVCIVHKIFKNVIYRIDVRPFTVAGVPC